MDTNDPLMKKRKRFDWTTKTDPDTGAVSRFCARCQDFLLLDRFYNCHLKNGNLLCKTHANDLARGAHTKWRRRSRGEPGSLKRIRTTLNAWVMKQKKGWTLWTEDEVARVLAKHSVALPAKDRIPRLRPLEKSLPFNEENVVVKFQLGSSANPKPIFSCVETCNEYIRDAIP